MKHTPGPWEHNDTDMLQVQGRVMGYSVPISLIQKRSVGPMQAKANARLIAAAPELLEALKQLVNRFEQSGAYDHDHTIELAQSVIAKAEGQS